MLRAMLCLTLVPCFTACSHTYAFNLERAASAGRMRQTALHGQRVALVLGGVTDVQRGVANGHEFTLLRVRTHVHTVLRRLLGADVAALDNVDRVDGSYDVYLRPTLRFAFAEPLLLGAGGRCEAHMTWAAEDASGALLAHTTSEGVMKFGVMSTGGIACEGATYAAVGAGVDGLLTDLRRRERLRGQIGMPEKH